MYGSRIVSSVGRCSQGRSIRSIVTRPTTSPLLFISTGAQLSSVPRRSHLSPGLHMTATGWLCAFLACPSTTPSSFSAMGNTFDLSSLTYSQVPSAGFHRTERASKTPFPAMTSIWPPSLMAAALVPKSTASSIRASVGCPS